MRLIRVTVTLVSSLLALPIWMLGQTATPPASAPDAITFVNGDRISGQIIGTTSQGLLFHSTLVGDITVEWSSIRDLHSESGFGKIMGNQSAAVTPPPRTLTVPQEPVTVAGQTPAPVPVPAPAAVAPPQVARAEQPASPARPTATPPSNGVTTNAATAPASAPATSTAGNEHTWFGHQLFSGWQGNATAGLAYVAASTSLVSFTPSVNLMRTWPKAKGSWPVRARTYLDFMANYSKETQHGDLSYFDPVRRTLFIPGSFDETYTMHAEIVQDYFLFPRLFISGGAIFDHNYAQSLDLLQSYGGGPGYVVFRTDKTEVDLRAGVGYAKQQYDGYPGRDTSVIASRFYESFEHRFANGMSFSEQGGIRPAWTDPKYLFAGGQLSFNMPVYHHLNLNVSSFDFWSRTPPPLLKKNIFQVALGVAYAF